MDDNIKLAALDAFLSSEDSPDDCMMLSDLDGFLHGVICSPVMITSEEWMTVALAANPVNVPDWVLHDITDLYIGIAKGLAESPAIVEPIFWQAKEGHVIAMDWCEGFMQAVSLRPKEWLRLIESGSDGHLMTPIMHHMLDDNGNSAMGVSQEELDEVLAEAAEEIPKAVSGIFNFWQRKHP